MALLHVHTGCCSVRVQLRATYYESQSRTDTMTPSGSAGHSLRCAYMTAASANRYLARCLLRAHQHCGVHPGSADVVAAAGAGEDGAGLPREPPGGQNPAGLPAGQLRRPRRPRRCGRRHERRQVAPPPHCPRQPLTAVLAATCCLLWLSRRFCSLTFFCSGTGCTVLNGCCEALQAWGPHGHGRRVSAASGENGRYIWRLRRRLRRLWPI